MRTRTRSAAACVLATVGVVALSGCGAWSSTQHGSDTYEVDEQVEALDLEGGSGHVEVVAADHGTVRVTERVAYTDDAPKTSHRVVNGRLMLGYDSCRQDSSVGLHRCEVSYRVEVPAGLTVDVEMSSGEVTLRELAGDVRLKSASGDVRIFSPTGSVRAAASSGDMTIRRAEARHLRLETTSGNIDAGVTAVPERVAADVTSGDVTLRLPDGDYAVDTSTSSGEERVEVRTDGESSHRVTATTTSGDIAVLSQS